MTTGLAAKRTQLSSFEQRRGPTESFEFIWPASDVSVQLDEVVLIRWTQAIESDEIGALWIYLVDKVEESRVMIGRNITGSESVWTVPLDIEFFEVGRSYWFELEVFPKHRVAVSEKFKLVKSSSQLWMKSLSSPQTAVPTSEDDEVSGTSESDYLEASNPDTQTLSAGATVGIATGALLGITLLVLIGVLVYRRKRSYKGHHKTEEGQDAAVVSIPEQHSGTNIPEMEAFGPKARTGDNAGACGHTPASRDFHEME
ncbi:hypothetical protein INS49_014081 [Diaporthe citri]|uniref:uncharacterized protein n=1 Tax=Diaporthe citri TaxID=83186 RepID=UPI001C7E31C6|nr:uncharacterized protein INS49_014081 [Diaporthe citri]KAG6358197.1 hypothetical protein INS49_014081 [Diaporthe citri]